MCERAQWIRDAQVRSFAGRCHSAYKQIGCNARRVVHQHAQALPQNTYKTWHLRHTLYDVEFEKGITYVTTQDAAKHFITEVAWLFTCTVTRVRSRSYVISLGVMLASVQIAN